MVPESKEGRGKKKIDPATIRRNKPVVQSTEEAEEEKQLPVTAGAIEKMVDLAFNPSKEKIREFTSIDRVQGRLLPQLDVIALSWRHVIETAAFRQDADEYTKIYKRKRPVPPDLVGEFIYRTAQWQKSVGAQNMKSAIDLALAETEVKGEEVEPFGGHGFDED